MKIIEGRHPAGTGLPTDRRFGWSNIFVPPGPARLDRLHGREGDADGPFHRLWPAARSQGRRPWTFAGQVLSATCQTSSVTGSGALLQARTSFAVYRTPNVVTPISTAPARIPPSSRGGRGRLARGGACAETRVEGCDDLGAEVPNGNEGEKIAFCGVPRPYGGGAAWAVPLTSGASGSTAGWASERPSGRRPVRRQGTARLLLSRRGLLVALLMSSETTSPAPAHLGRLEGATQPAPRRGAQASG